MFSLIISGDRSWFVGMAGTVVMMGVFVSVAVYFVHYRASLGRFRRLKRPEALLEIDEDGFRVTSDRGSVKLPLERYRKDLALSEVLAAIPNWFRIHDDSTC
jgi:hypothetical protein